MHIATAKFAQKPMGAVSPRDGVEFLSELKTKHTSYDPKKHGKRVPKPLSWQTRKHCLNLARRAFDYAIANELMNGTNPFAGLSVEREDDDEDEGFQEDWYLDPRDQQRLLSEWVSVRRIAFLTSARRSRSSRRQRPAWSGRRARRGRSEWSVGWRAV